MRKKIIILMLAVLFLAGCGNTKEKKQEKDYSEYLFSDVIWTRDGGNDIETLVFKSDGSFRYYCACGNPVNDSDLCESYVYNDNTKEINFNGEIRKFEKSE